MTLESAIASLHDDGARVKNDALPACFKCSRPSVLHGHRVCALCHDEDRCPVCSGRAYVAAAAPFPAPVSTRRDSEPSPSPSLTDDLLARLRRACDPCSPVDVAEHARLVYVELRRALTNPGWR